MPAEALSEAIWTQLSGVIADSTGLHFPPNRHADLQRGLAAAAVEFGFAEVSGCVDWLLSATPNPAQLSILANHLVVGETYFFRERKTLDALAREVLPQLLRRQDRQRCLRLWSAACSTGEEPYSLAIMAQELLREYPDWQVMILATDINERSLHKAAAGIYSEWSFRDCPAEFKRRYFTCTADGRFSIAPEIKSRVTFARMNLVGDDFPLLGGSASAMDAILCRNLLMYFTASQAQRLVERLGSALADEGWLAVSPSEYSQTLFPGFTPVNFPGSILYRKGAAMSVSVMAAQMPSPVELPSATQPIVGSRRVANMAPLSTPTSLLAPVSTAAQEPRALSHLAQTMANQGELGDALTMSERWIAADKADPQAHYLQATILLEQGEREGARRALQRATYLRPDFAVAYFALGNLARGAGRAAEARRHFVNALRLLRACPSEELLSEFDGMTAGHLVQIITTVLARSERLHAAQPE